VVTAVGASAGEQILKPWSPQRPRSFGSATIPIRAPPTTPGRRRCKSWKTVVTAMTTIYQDLHHRGPHIPTTAARRPPTLADPESRGHRNDNHLSRSATAALPTPPTIPAPPTPQTLGTAAIRNDKRRFKICHHRRPHARRPGRQRPADLEKPWSRQRQPSIKICHHRVAHVPGRPGAAGVVLVYAWRACPRQPDGDGHRRRETHGERRIWPGSVVAAAWLRGGSAATVFRSRVPRGQASPRRAYWVGGMTRRWPRRPCWWPARGRSSKSS
jgi:hypothetical protein